MKVVQRIMAMGPQGHAIGLAVLALLWRVPFLGRADLWDDEILYARRSSPPQGLRDIVQSHLEVFPELPYLPLPSIIQNLFLQALSPFTESVLHSAWAQRVPAVIFGALTAPVIYFLIRKIADQRVALLTATMQAVFYFPLFYSREARFYAPLQLMVGVVFLLYFHVLRTGRLGRWSGGGLFIAATMLCHSALNGLLFVGSLLGLSVLCIVTGWRPAETDKARWQRLHLWLLIPLALSIATFLPFLIEYLAKGTGLAPTGVPGIWTLIHDILGRTLMGTKSIAWWGSLLLLALGVARLASDQSNRFYPGALALSLFVVFVTILFNVVRSEYYFARLFYGLTFGIHWLAALGMVGVCYEFRLVRRLSFRVRTIAFAVLVFLVCGVHAFIYAPKLWALQAKSNDYAGMAEWLNEHLSPGTPYVLESAYQLRFISGHYETPGLVPAVPYVHQAGMGELERLRERQRAFLLRFPEAYYVESAMHKPLWSWPDTYFRHQVELVNEPLKNIIEWGVEGPHFRDTPERYKAKIYYNERDDIIAMRKADGEAVYVTYPDWSLVQYAQYQYARYHEKHHASIKVLNLKDEPVRGRLVVQGAVRGQPGQQYVWLMRSAGLLDAQAKVPGGQFFQIESAEIELPAQEIEVELSVPSLLAQKQGGFLIHEIEFNVNE
jgi:hypothetical protein